MGPRDHRIAQTIGMREQKPEDCPDASGRRSHDESHRREPQQAATFVCDLPVVVRVMVHGWSMIPRPSQGIIFAKITGECPGKECFQLDRTTASPTDMLGTSPHVPTIRYAEPRPRFGSQADFDSLLDLVRLSPESRHCSPLSRGQPRAKNRQSKQPRPDQPQMRTRRSRQPCPSQKRWVIQWQGGIGSPTGAST